MIPAVALKEPGDVGRANHAELSPVKIPEACGLPGLSKAVSNFFDGRYYPYGHAREYAIGTELYELMRGRRMPMSMVSEIVNRSERELMIISGGLYDSDRINDGEIGKFAQAVGTTMKSLRRIGDDAEGHRAKVRAMPDIGLRAMTSMLDSDRKAHPEDYLESGIVGMGVRIQREWRYFSRKQLASRSKVPIEFITLLEHGSLPHQFAHDIDVQNLCDTLNVGREFVEGIGMFALMHGADTLSSRMEIARNFAATL